MIIFWECGFEGAPVRSAPLCSLTGCWFAPQLWDVDFQGYCGAGSGQGEWEWGTSKHHKACFLTKIQKVFMNNAA